MFSVRRVEPSDTDAIENLIQSRGGVTHFGDETKSVSRRVEESTLSVVTVLDDSTIVAFATFSQKCNRESSELWLSGMGKGGPSCSDSLWTSNSQCFVTTAQRMIWCCEIVTREASSR